MNICIVIPSYNRKDKLIELLDCLTNNESWDKGILKIVCVIDGSTDGTQNILKKDWRAVHMVEGDGNWWYTKCINEGLNYGSKEFSADFFLIMNDDTFVKSGYVDELITIYSQLNEKCLLGSISITMNKPHLITFSGVIKQTSFPWSVRHILPHMSKWDQSLRDTHKTHYLPGRSIMFHKKVFEDTGGLDETFPQYHSDIDFSLRAQSLGYNSYVTYRTPVFSYHELTRDAYGKNKASIKSFFQSLKNPHGRRHFGQQARYFWRHEQKVLFPFFITKWFFVLLMKYGLGKKI
jgi:GT2 family glycosyltransferase